MTLDYTCKFCRGPGTVDMPRDTIAGLAMIDPEKWLAILSCNRCAEYNAERISLRDRLTFVAVQIIRRRQLNEWSAEVEAVIRSKIAALTQQFAGLVCRHHRKNEVWEPEFVSMLVEQPDRTHEILRSFERQISA